MEAVKQQTATAKKKHQLLLPIEMPERLTQKIIIQCMYVLCVSVEIIV